MVYMNKYLQLAINQAKAHEYEPNLDYKLCAVITRGGSILSIGFNQRKTNAFVEHYTDRTRGSERGYCLSTHAEMHSVTQIRAKTDLTGCKIYVARVRPTGTLAPTNVGMARPCKICENVLYSYGIKRAYYTIDDYNYGVMKIDRKNEIITDSYINSYDIDACGE